MIIKYGPKGHDDLRPTGSCVRACVTLVYWYDS